MALPFAGTGWILSTLSQYYFLMMKILCWVTKPSRRIRIFSLVVLLLAAMGSQTSILAADEPPANIDNALRRLLSVTGQDQGRAVAAAKPTGKAAVPIRDSENRVLVDIHLNGKIALPDVRNQLSEAGAKIVSENASYRHGMFSAFVAASKISELARSPGVLSISLSRRPRRNVGATTSGGVFLLHTDMLNSQGLDGTGQTVGVLSDSFDTAQINTSGGPLTIHAAQDIASGDLPGPGNPNNSNPVFVVEDFTDPTTIDEGRAMLQIVHDVAPKAKLAFATAYVSKPDFAANIRKLRTDANCDVIVDDVTYTEEPMFSDGIIAQAVDDVATSETLPGVKCAYFSSAGNYQGGGYVSTFNPISDATARAGLPGQNLKLDQVPAALTSGGFHNFEPDPADPPDISQAFLITGGASVEFSFQWNDPFDVPGGVTTDYNILIFDADGNYLAGDSGTADNFMTQEAVEDITFDNPGGNAIYQIVITRAGNSPATPVARTIRYLALDDTGGIGAEEYYQAKAPSSHGHSSAKGAIGVAAYVYDDSPSNPPGPPFTPAFEDFSSAGPATIDFDANGNRLAVSEVRLKPDIAAPDGGNTTFFGDDYEGDGFPNFFGTSAAAPHAAGVAALLLQKAGGPASIAPQQLSDLLKSTVTAEHDLDPFFSHAVAGPTRFTRRTKRFTGAMVNVTACGNASNASSHDRNFFTITFDSTRARETLKSVTIDINPAGLNFDTSTDVGFPLTLGELVNIAPQSITTTTSSTAFGIESVKLIFAPGSFTTATSVSFGVDRDYIGDGAGNQADILQGAIVSASTSRNNLRGTFVNDVGFGFSIADGFGLIDAVAAAQQVDQLTQSILQKR
ncbi:MAG: hypothetical protein QOG67_1300 [Verrucomicrobiota bacterium]|jgi:hypothetical protein